MHAKRPNRSRSLELLAVAVGGLLFTASLLGLNCEIACAGNAARTVSVEDRAPAADHCAPQEDSSPGRPSGAPPAADECGHHGDSFVVKRSTEGAAGCKFSNLSGSVPAPTRFVFSPSSIFSTLTTAGARPQPAAARSRILRL